MVGGSRRPVTVDLNRLFVLTRFSGHLSGVVVLIMCNGVGRRFGDLHFGCALHHVTKSDANQF